MQEATKLGCCIFQKWSLRIRVHNHLCVVILCRHFHDDPSNTWNQVSSSYLLYLTSVSYSLYFKLAQVRSYITTDSCKLCETSFSYDIARQKLFVMSCHQGPHTGSVLKKPFGILFYIWRFLENASLATPWVSRNYNKLMLQIRRPAAPPRSIHLLHPSKCATPKHLNFAAI